MVGSLVVAASDVAWVQYVVPPTIAQTLYFHVPCVDDELLRSLMVKVLPLGLREGELKMVEDGGGFVTHANPGGVPSTAQKLPAAALPSSCHVSICACALCGMWF